MEFYLKYSTIIVIIISLVLTAILYKILLICKNRKKFKTFLIIFYIAFIIINFSLITIRNYPVPILYRNAIIPAILASLSVTIFFKPKN